MSAACPFSPKELRQLVLQHQGLLQPVSGKAAVAEVLKQISYVQLDSIYVVERAHHHVLYNRVKNYQPSMLIKRWSKNKVLNTGRMPQHFYPPKIIVLVCSASCYCKTATTTGLSPNSN